jgi:uncharacterized protein YukE
MSYKMNWHALESSVLPDLETVPRNLNQLLDRVQNSVSDYANNNAGEVAQAYLKTHQQYDRALNEMTSSMGAGINALREIIAATKRADAAGAANF